MATFTSVNREPVLLNPLLFQVNTRAILTELSRQLGRNATFDDIPDSFLARIQKRGFDIVYMLGVWQTGEAGLQMSINKMSGQHPLSDISSSPFAITSYTVNVDFGGEDCLIRFRTRLQTFGLKLLLDFVPNHVASMFPLFTQI